MTQITGGQVGLRPTRPAHRAAYLSTWPSTLIRSCPRIWNCGFAASASVEDKLSSLSSFTHAGTVYLSLSGRNLGRLILY